MAFGCGTSTVDTPNHCRNLITPAETLRPPYEGEVPLLLEMLYSRDIARKPGLLRPQGIVNLADRGHLLRPARLERGSAISEQRTFRPEPLRHPYNKHTMAV